MAEMTDRVNNDSVNNNGTNQILYIKTSLSDESLFFEYFEKYLDKVSEELGVKLRVKAKLNIIKKRLTDGIREGQGYGFLWVSDKRVYNLLLGNNPDGTERFKEYYDEEWDEPKKPLFEAISEAIDKERAKGNNIGPFGYDWKVAMQIDDELNLLYKRPIIKSGIGPLIEFPTIIGQDGVTYPLEFYQCKLPDLDIKYNPNVLLCRKLPLSISADEIKNLVSLYTTSKNKEYPSVRITDDRLCFVTFDPTTDDAKYTLCIIKRVILHDKRGVKHDIYFDHSYR